jgi:RHS repeat-associated protein
MPGRSYLNGVPHAKEGFTGKETDSESRFIYFGARYYDPALGRFISVDPQASNYSNLSSYSYVNNNIDNSRNSIVHEREHTKETIKTLKNADKNPVIRLKIEKKAINAQKKHKTWEKTTGTYKKKINDYDKFWDRMKKIRKNLNK